MRGVTTWGLPIWFAGFSLSAVALTVNGGNLGGDARLYALAARAWLAGGDPWHAGIQWGLLGQHWTVYYASLPPTLLFFAPFAYLPAWLVAASWIALDSVAMVLVLRALRLPWWWLLWPPFVSGAAVGNPEPLVLGLLVLAGGRLAALSPLVKIYAVIPLIGEQRWRLLIASGALLAVTAVLLPWARFADDRSWFAQVYAAQSGAGDSATAVPTLVPLALVALAVMGWRRAGWLAVPTLWPGTHGHYATTALPAMTPLIALVSLVPVPGAFGMAVILQGGLDVAVLIREKLRARLTPAPSAPVLP